MYEIIHTDVFTFSFAYVSDAALKGDRGVNVIAINNAITEQLKRIGSNFKRRKQVISVFLIQE